MSDQENQENLEGRGKRKKLSKRLSFPPKQQKPDEKDSKPVVPGLNVTLRTLPLLLMWMMIFFEIVCALDKANLGIYML